MLGQLIGSWDRVGDWIKNRGRMQGKLVDREAAQHLLGEEIGWKLEKTAQQLLGDKVCWRLGEAAAQQLLGGEGGWKLGEAA